MIKSNLLQIVEKIIAIDSNMRFASIIDLNGNIIEGIMKAGKTSLETQKQEEYFCKQVAKRRKMRMEFNRQLGKVRYVHVEREKVTQFVIYTKRKIVLITIEPELTIQRKIGIINTIKRITANI
tara:strand:+ start:306 stop:677 length:372 start_codon:yes stop_codon:yes gene_type:complete